MTSYTKMQFGGYRWETECPFDRADPTWFARAAEEHSSCRAETVRWNLVTGGKRVAVEVGHDGVVAKASAFLTVREWASPGAVKDALLAFYVIAIAALARAVPPPDDVLFESWDASANAVVSERFEAICDAGRSAEYAAFMNGDDRGIERYRDGVAGYLTDTTAAVSLGAIRVTVDEEDEGVPPWVGGEHLYGEAGDVSEGGMHHA